MREFESPHWTAANARSSSAEPGGGYAAWRGHVSRLNDVQLGKLTGLVVQQEMTTAVIGTAAGLMSAFLSARVVPALLVGVTPYDAVTFVAMPLMLVMVSAAACLVPARRATSVDPVVLRGQ